MPVIPKLIQYLIIGSFTRQLCYLFVAHAEEQKLLIGHGTHHINHRKLSAEEGACLFLLEKFLLKFISLVRIFRAIS